jgi:hypothetical protein
MSIPATRLSPNPSNQVAAMRRLIPERICGPHECLFDVAMDAGVAAVVALVVTESLRSLKSEERRWWPFILSEPA